MGYEPVRLPAALQGFLEVTVGMKWPNGNEVLLGESADVWLRLGEVLEGARGAFGDDVSRLGGAMSGEWVDRVVESYSSGMADMFDQLVDAAGKFGDAMLQTAASVQKAKIMIGVFLALLAATIIELAFSFFGAGFIPVVIAAGRAAIGAVLRWLAEKAASLSLREVVLKLTTREGLAALGGVVQRAGVALSGQVGGALSREGLKAAGEVAGRAGRQFVVDVAKYGAFGAGVMGFTSLAIDGVQNLEETEGGQRLREGVDGQGALVMAFMGGLGGALFGAGRSLARGIDNVTADLRSALAGTVLRNLPEVSLEKLSRGLQPLKDVLYSGLQVAVGGVATNVAINVAQGPAGVAAAELLGEEYEGGAAASPLSAGLLGVVSRSQGAGPNFGGAFSGLPGVVEKLRLSVAD
ncbi:hypothetical protein, partial [Amycolatopsis sp. NPDC049868]|uniref:WXG100-like domain-containing protein n=1 Tax=Amycolatopsis sp. NPDC049868 TaxID=3363934 RepID=UPI0037B8C5E2